jgi:hypothetical protein
MHFITWLQRLPISEWISDSTFGFPLLLSIHSIGMGMVVGLLLMLDIRVLGYRKDVPLIAFDRLMNLAWVGFGINAVSGTLLFMADAERLIVNWPFLVKMVCVVLGGILAFALWRALHEPASFDEGTGQALIIGEPGDRAKGLAALSIGILILAIIGGRLIGVVMSADMLKATL